MEILMNDINKNLEFFLLMFIRISALIVASPIFGRSNLPQRLKIGFCIILSFIIFPTLDKHVIEYYGFIDFAFLCIKELMFGLILSFITTLFFSLVQTSGFVMDRMMAFGMVSVYDPQSNSKIPVTGNLLYIILIVMFFKMNAHHQLIFILHATFDQIPVGKIVINPQIAFIMIEAFILTFIMAVNLAMPIVASGLLAEVTLGFMGRLIPQMNVFVIGMPMKIAIGLAMLMLIMPVYIDFTQDIVIEMFNFLDKAFRTLGSA